MGRRLLAVAGLAVLWALLPASAQAEDVTVTSFDGTQIVAHWFPVEGAGLSSPRPTVMMGPGWGSPGDVNVEGTGATGVGAIGIKTLHDAGYNVLTWDPRGFGKSGGTVEVDSPEFEARDTKKLISWLATRPEVKLDKPGDPRLGMAGASYGGGIQLVTAAADRRIDALAPTIAWNSLRTSQYKADTVKIGWAQFLYLVALGRPLDPHIKSAYDEGLATGILSAEDKQWFKDRGPGALVQKIKVPTLFIQGTVDTLFTLDEAVRNFRILRKNQVPTKMLWFCGGHGACLTSQGDPNRASDATIDWFARYLKGKKVDTGPRFSAIDQNGHEFSARDYPPKAGTSLKAEGSGTLAMQAEGGAGPAVIAPGAGGLGALVAPITPAKADNAVNVNVTARSKALVVGAPRLDLTYKGTVPGPRPARVFAQLVDARTGLVVGNQITPIALRLDGKKHTVTGEPLEVVSQRMKKGDSLTLQLVATTVAYALPRLGGSVDFSKVGLTLPTLRR